MSDTAVHKAIRTGRITPQPDGAIDPARADEDWSRNTETPDPGTRQGAVKALAAEAGDEAPPLLPTGGASVLQARTVKEVLKAQTDKVRLVRLKGKLVVQQPTNSYRRSPKGLA